MVLNVKKKKITYFEFRDGKKVKVVKEVEFHLTDMELVGERIKELRILIAKGEATNEEKEDFLLLVQ